jgi:hypothetical protein
LCDQIIQTMRLRPPTLSDGEESMPDMSTKDDRSVEYLVIHDDPEIQRYTCRLAIDVIGPSAIKGDGDIPWGNAKDWPVGVADAARRPQTAAGKVAKGHEEYVDQVRFDFSRPDVL